MVYRNNFLASWTKNQCLGWGGKLCCEVTMNRMRVEHILKQANRPRASYANKNSDTHKHKQTVSPITRVYWICSGTTTPSAGVPWGRPVWPLPLALPWSIRTNSSPNNRALGHLYRPKRPTLFVTICSWIRDSRCRTELRTWSWGVGTLYISAALNKRGGLVRLAKAVVTHGKTCS